MDMNIHSMDDDNKFHQNVDFPSIIIVNKVMLKHLIFALTLIINR
jgi:hypothetical protein